MTSAAPAPSCPKCGATTIQTTAVARTKVDASLATEYFRATGNRDPKRTDTVVVQACQRCGCQWVPRTNQERQFRALSGQLGPDAMKAAQAEEIARAAKGKQPAGFGLSLGLKMRPFTLLLVIITAILVVLVFVTA
jgi:hypothetical protein